MMARVLRLTDSNGTTTVDLLAGTLHLQSTSWSTRTPPVNGEYRHSEFGAQPVFKNYGVVTEQMYLVGEDTPENLVAAVSAVEELLEQARLYHRDPTRSNAVWLEWGTDGEATASNAYGKTKRALIYEGSVRMAAGIGVSPMMQHQVLRVQLTLSRHPVWEDVVYRTAYDGGSINAFGGVWQPAPDGVVLVGGTAPMRPSRLEVSGFNGGGGPIYRIWVGIRPERNGTSGFVPVLDVEKGTVATDASIDTDSSAHGGSRVSVSFGTVATLTERASLTLGDVVAADYAHFSGRYVLLLRYRLTDTNTMARIRLRYGLRNAGGLLENEAVYTFENNANWRILPLGEVVLPPGERTPANDSAMKDLEFVIDAERVTGNGSLYLDALCLMPSEHLFSAEGGDIWYDTSYTGAMYGYVFDDDRTGASALRWDFSSSSYALNTNVAYVMRDWYFPVEGGVVVFVGERVDEHVLTDAVLLSMEVYRRWLGYRRL